MFVCDVLFHLCILFDVSTTCESVCVCAHKYVCVHACMCECVCVCVHACMCV